MKIVFMGTPAFAVPSLEILLKNNYNVVSVVTTTDKKKGRGLSVSHSDIKNFAIKNNLDIIQPESLKDSEFIETLKSLNPDLIIVVAFRILPEEVFSIPKFGSFNLHASLLPKYRGAAPINRAIINGEKETGVTSFFLKAKVDTGNIILQKKNSIEENDDAGTLHDKLSLLGAEAVLETVKLIETGNVQTTPQDESLASPAPKIFKEDCLINWNQNSKVIYNFIRGLSPYPAAFTYLKGKVIKIYKSKITNSAYKDSIGRIIIEESNLFVVTNDYLLELLELKVEGKKKISGLEFINGVNSSTGLIFTDSL